MQQGVIAPEPRVGETLTPRCRSHCIQTRILHSAAILPKERLGRNPRAIGAKGDGSGKTRIARALWRWHD
jgi:hypothetical protein